MVVTYNIWYCPVCNQYHNGTNTCTNASNTIGTGNTISNITYKVDDKYETFEEACYALAQDLASLVIDKQKDYGTSNILESPGGAGNGIVVRLWDKISRLKNLVFNNLDPKNESIEDTYSDIVGYALVALMVQKGYFTLPLEKEE